MSVKKYNEKRGKLQWITKKTCPPLLAKKIPKIARLRLQQLKSADNIYV